MRFLFLLLSVSLIPLISCADASFQQMTKQIRSVMLNAQVDQGSVDKIATEIVKRMCEQKQTLSQVIHDFPKVVQGRTSGQLNVIGLKSYRDLNPCYKNSGSTFDVQMEKLGVGLDTCLDAAYKAAQKLCATRPKLHDYIRKEFTDAKVKTCMSQVKKQQVGTPCPKCFQCSKDHANSIFKFPAGV